MPDGAATPGEAFGQYLAAVRRWWPLAVAIVAVAAVVAYALATQRPASYIGTAKVLIGQQRQVDSVLGSADYSPDPERDLNTSLQLITLEPIANKVARSLGSAESGAALVGRVTTAVDRNSNIVAISARAANAARAAAIANAFARGYRAYRAETASAALRDAIASARRRLADLPPGGARTRLERALAELEVAEPFQTGGVRIVDAASPASAVRRPRPLLSAFVGGFLGLIVAALAIVVLARIDRRVRGDGDVERLTGRPVLARIPRSRAAAADALVSLALAQRDRRVVLLTSAGPGEGTPEVALGLARALGVVGRPAIAIEADLRRPAFGAGPGGGLVAILTGAATFDAELTSIGLGAAAVPAGTTHSLPQALLAGERMAATVEQARRQADAVVIAGPPVDVAALAGLVDAVLLVTRDDVTRADDLRRALRVLTDAGAAPAGVVVTVRPRWRPFGAAPAGRRRSRRGAPATATTSEVTVG